MLAAPDPRVQAWIDREPEQTLYTTAVTEAEIRVGIALMPEGRRRRELASAAERLLTELFAGRILPFDSAAAQMYGTIAVSRRAAGREFDTRDCLIAAIARSHGAGVATRDVRGFVDCGVEITNPWDV